MENLKKEAELQNTTMGIKITIERINSRLRDAEEPVRNLEDRLMESKQVEQQKENNSKNEDKRHLCGSVS